MGFFSSYTTHTTCRDQNSGPTRRKLCQQAAKAAMAPRTRHPSPPPPPPLVAGRLAARQRVHRKVGHSCLNKNKNYARTWKSKNSWVKNVLCSNFATNRRIVNFTHHQIDMVDDLVVWWWPWPRVLQMNIPILVWILCPKHRNASTITVVIAATAVTSYTTASSLIDPLGIECTMSVEKYLTFSDAHMSSPYGKKMRNATICRELEHAAARHSNDPLFLQENVFHTQQFLLLFSAAHLYRKYVLGVSSLGSGILVNYYFVDRNK